MAERFARSAQMVQQSMETAAHDMVDSFTAAFDAVFSRDDPRYAPTEAPAVEAAEAPRKVRRPRKPKAPKATRSDLLKQDPFEK